MSDTRTPTPAYRPPQRPQRPQPVLAQDDTDDLDPLPADDIDPPTEADPVPVIDTPADRLERLRVRLTQQNHLGVDLVHELRAVVVELVNLLADPALVGSPRKPDGE